MARAKAVRRPSCPTCNGRGYYWVQPDQFGWPMHRARCMSCRPYTVAELIDMGMLEETKS